MPTGLSGVGLPSSSSNAILAPWKWGRWVKVLGVTEHTPLRRLAGPECPLCPPVGLRGPQALDMRAVAANPAGFKCTVGGNTEASVESCCGPVSSLDRAGNLVKARRSWRIIWPKDPSN